VDFFIGNTNIITLSRLRAAADNSYIENAVVTVTIKDADGEEVTGQDWPVTLEEINESPPKGNYRGVLSEELVLEPKTSYVAHVDVNAGQSRIGHWEIPFVARTRFG
jgi:hypothetical protein